MAVGDHTDSAEPHDLPVVIDTTKASIARVYDAFLDGKDNYEIDRKVMNDVLRIAPHSKLVAKATRRWLVRVIRYLVTAGVDQFLDCGSGIPTAENTHQVAQRHNPDAVVIYVDIDPIVSAYGRALLVENDRTHFVQADVRRPRALLAHPTVTEHLDFTRPIAMIQCAIMHHIDDEAAPVQIMAEYIDALPSGSFVGFSHFWDPEDGGEGSELAYRIETCFRTSSMGTGRYRTRAEIKATCWLDWTCSNPDSSSSTSGGLMVPSSSLAHWWSASSWAPSAASANTGQPLAPADGPDASVGPMSRVGAACGVPESE